MDALILQDFHEQGIPEIQNISYYINSINIESWTDHVRNEDIRVLRRVKEQRNILHEIRKRKANWIGHILRRNCLLQRVTEGKIKWGDRSDRKTRKKT
jgi:hypothetical protein